MKIIVFVIGLGFAIPSMGAALNEDATGKPIRIESNLAASMFFLLESVGVPSVFAGRNGYVMTIHSIECSDSQGEPSCLIDVLNDGLQPIVMDSNTSLQLKDKFTESGTVVNGNSSKVEDVLCQLIPEHAYCRFLDTLAQ